MNINLINKKQIRVLVCILLLLVEITSIFFCIKSYNNKNLDKYIFGKQGILKSDMFAVLVENDKGKYEEVETFPDFPYVFNMSKSGCIDSNGNRLIDSLLYNEEEKEVTVRTMNSSQCYLYYNKPKEVLATHKLMNSGDLWDSGLEGDGLRYVGTGSSLCSYDNGNYITVSDISTGTPTCPILYNYTRTTISNGSTTSSSYKTSCPDNTSSYTYECTEIIGQPYEGNNPDNFICFGTASSEECKLNESKYMYRIIGVFTDEQGIQHLKIKKYKELEKKSWHNENVTINWENSSLKAELNGNGFLKNTYYNYLQNEIWLNKIENWKWLTATTMTYSNSGPNYMTGSTMTPKNIYLHEMNRSTKTSTKGEWLYAQAKIGLIYASDYVLSLGNDALNISGSTSSNYAKLKTSWMHLSNNDLSGTTEWTITNCGSGSGERNYAWAVSSGGGLYSGSGTVTTLSSIVPTFYLTSDVSIGSGIGSYDEPYIIDEENKLDMDLSLNDGILKIDITKYTNNLNKYCINKSFTINDCEWKKINSDSIEENIPGVGIYYVHVIDDKGYIVHRNIEILESITEYLINNGNLWSSGLEGDGLRYVGSGAYNGDTTPSNFICFGTTSASECKANEDKYMYRIIGVFPDEEGNQHLKLRKFKQLGTKAWHSTNEAKNWGESTLYTELNGSYFLGNTTYDYLQNATWSDKIVEWKWTAVNTKTYDDSIDPNYFNGSKMTPANIYLHEMNRSTKKSEVGEWTYPTGKIGLIYASDYVLSLGDEALAITAGSTSSHSAKLKTGWLHYTNNLASSSSAYDWTIARSEDFDGYFLAWVVDSTGNVKYTLVTSTYAVAPVFYLTSDVYKNGGTGAYTDPYILK